MDDPIYEQKPLTDIEYVEGDAITPDIDDDEIIRACKADEAEYEGRFKQLEKIREKNEKYYVGDQVDKNKLKVGEAEVVDNRVLLSIETMVSIISATTPAPWVIVTPRTRKGRKLRQKLERHLRDEWEFLQALQQKCEKVIRTYFLSRYAILKIRWDDDIEDFVIDFVRPEKVKFSLDAQCIDDSPFVIQYDYMTIAEAMDKFPDKKEFFEKLLEKKDVGSRSRIPIKEYWGKYKKKGKSYTYTCWIYKNEVLGKEFNMYWNTKGKNHFKKPRHPYMVFNSMSTGKSLVDDTSLTEQVLTLQDIVNKRKRQIDLNASLSNGIIVGASQFMDAATFDKIQFTAKEKIFLNGEVEDVRAAIQILTGNALDQGIFNDLADSRNEIDNLYGVHATTRGERQPGEQTAHEIQSLRDADYGRLDLTTRAYEQLAEEIYSWMIQMMYVEYDKNKTILSLEDEESPMDDYKVKQGLVPTNELNDTINKDELKEFDVKVIVKKGSTKPDDPAAMQNMALTLMQTGQLDPLTFAEVWNGDPLPDPRTSARRLFLWNSDPASLFPELQGADLIDYEAIKHIKNINAGDYGAKDELFENADLDNIDQYQKHVDTHRLYGSGVELDDDLTPFPELDDELKMRHRDHLEAEMLRLEKLMQAYQQREEQRAIEGGMPVGAMPPEAGMEGLLPGAVGGVPAPTMGTGTLAGGNIA